MHKPINLSKIKSKVLKIRERTSLRGKVPLETMNESHAREFVVRVVAVPFLKKNFKDRLKAILIVGSVQRGVRKATSTNKISDVDVLIVLKDALNKNTDIEIRDNLIRLGQKSGVRLSPMFKDAKSMQSEKKIQAPFQVMYGKNFVLQELGKDYEKAQTIKKEKAKNKSKYAGRM